MNIIIVHIIIKYKIYYSNLDFMNYFQIIEILINVKIMYIYFNILTVSCTIGAKSVKYSLLELQ